MQFTFTHMDGSKSTVQAKDERTARQLAMEAKWGRPRSLSLPIPGTTQSYTVIGAGGYQGNGLTLD